MDMEIIIILVVFVCNIVLLICGIRLWLNCKDYRTTLNLVLNYLDMAMSEKELPIIYDEKIESAIQAKLNEIIEISRIHRAEENSNQKMVLSLLSNIVHQVRTPLSNIMLYTGILEETLQIEDSKRIVEKIYLQSRKLDYFMKELVRSSYLETEMISVNIQEEEVDKLILESCQEVELSALKKKIIFDIRECGKKAKFDLKWTKEALINLLDNSIKYSSENSLITIRVFFYESFFCIQVTDQGIGIDEKEQGAIFKRFYRSEKVKSQDGIGIGLYLVREILERQGGYVKVKSSLNNGSTFYMYLPNVL